MKLIALILIVLVSILTPSCLNIDQSSHLVTFDMSGASGIQSVTITNSENGDIVKKLINPQNYFFVKLQSGTFFLVIDREFLSYCTSDILICGEYYLSIIVSDPLK